ncbi:hypothetical protein [Sphingomonas qomolangmaensis]|uniref:hypothetical protein n=1 Tax=Sphingomonas qomolangmaensis TaxID=2918765 RepID=UPI0029E8264C|nr:hypothetical protein [Sphingomonas qomolangmaensis]
MRKYHDFLLHSASDLNAFLGCAHAAALNLRKLRDPASLPDRATDEEGAKLIQDAGHKHEAAYLEHLKQLGDVAEVTASGSLEHRATATMVAMREGSEIVYQAAFLDQPWHGFVDFLRRVETPSALGSWSYEAVDTKLARAAKASHVLQLGLYSDLIAEVQGARPQAMHIVLGDGTCGCSRPPASYYRSSRRPRGVGSTRISTTGRRTIRPIRSPICPFSTGSPAAACRCATMS